VLLQALLLGSGLFAINTGGAEEERVEGIVQEGVLHQHEESAEQFVWVSGATLALAALVLVIRRPAASRSIAAAVVVATVAVAGLGFRVGRAGGQLVYVHGAASAYSSTASATSPDPTRTGDRHEGRDAHEARER
jgi:mRNA-degrading endonuclease toxin of MazEF toxin-antitoxin module